MPSAQSIRDRLAERAPAFTVNEDPFARDGRVLASRPADHEEKSNSGVPVRAGAFAGR